MHKFHRIYPYIIMIVINVACVVFVFIGYSDYLLHDYRTAIDLQLEGDWPSEGDKLIGFTPSRNSSTIRRHLDQGLSYHIFTDARGARVNAAGQQTPNNPGIMTIGGSFSWGHGLENEETFTEILGREFDVPVANFSFGSYGTVQSLQLLERNDDLRPKVIIYGFITDHLRRNLSPCAPSYAPFCLAVPYVDFDEQGNPYIHSPQTEYSQEIGQRFFEEVIWDNGSKFDDIKWATRITLSKIEKNRFGRFDYSNDYASREKSMKYLMNTMIEEAKRINATLVVVHIPYLNRQSTNPAPSELLNSLTSNVIFVDLSPAVTQYYRNPQNPALKLQERDGHPNQLAHELIAREIYVILKEQKIF